MENVFFDPWVGDDYWDDDNYPRILVLSESHHGNYRGRDLTQSVVERYLEYANGNARHEGWMSTFTRFTNVMIRNVLDYFDDEDEFWNSVVYYTYVQTRTMSGPRVSPSDEDFENSEDAFFEVLEEYQPDLIIVWGKRLWDNMSGNGYSEDGLYYYSTEEKEIAATWVFHPSTGKVNDSISGIKAIMELFDDDDDDDYDDDCDDDDYDCDDNDNYDDN
jgi:hypothetical protein